MSVKFFYDETAPLDVLTDKEKDRAFELNYKGFKEGLTQNELTELKALFEKGVKILENN